MPRAFLITHRRYNGVEEEFDTSAGDYSPERAAARLVDYGNVHPTSDGASECGSETSSECPEELYNLTKLAEVSLAAAAGKLIHPNNVIYQRSTSPRFADPSDKCAKMSVKMKDHQQSHLQVPHRTSPFHEDQTLAEERRRFLFERIETERDIQRDNRTAMLDVRLSPHHHHHHHHHRHHHHHHHQPYRSPDESQVDVCGKKNSFVAENRIEVPSLTGPVVSNGPQSRKSAAGTVDNSKTDDNEDHECPDCGKKYSTSSNLARHRQTHRSLGDKKARRCPHCDKVYVSMPAFSMHVRTHNQGCKCHYCGKCFSRPWLLQGHIRTHTGEKPFKCTICNKAFADKSNLRAHIQTHSNTKPHVCGRCGKAFALKSYLYKHEESSCMRAHHRSTSEKNDSTDRKTTSSSSSSSSKTNDTVSPSASTATGAANLQVNLSTPCVTASPTSVIVPRLALNNRNHQSCQPPSAFSAIIKHTAAAAAASECPSELAPASKRPCKESSTNSKEEKRKSINEYETKDTDIVSSMVIRTSVISPNPEHLGRFNSEVKKLSTFDYSDTTRSSAFSRPPAMTLNLAIA